MAKWSEDHMVVIGSLNSNFGLVGRTWLNWRPGGTLMWKVEDHRLGRSGSVMWQARTSNVVAPSYVG
jgi:hypothetical protein